MTFFRRILFSSKLQVALELLLYIVLSALALHATWLTWPDPFVDFSRELYLPWRVSLGDVLYRDLAYYFGPVSVYVNAALFALLGRPSIHALFALNFAFWVATLLALRALLRRIAPPLAATLAVSSFILLFSFNRYIFGGNFNYLAPYTHEITRGFLFALLSLLALDSALRRHSAPLALLAGVSLGLDLFAKPEIALASVGASAVLLLFGGGGRPARSESPPPPSLSSLVTRLSSLSFSFALGVLLALALVLVPLSIALGSFALALREGLLKLYLDCFNPALTNLFFFKNTLGTDAPLSRAAWLLLGTACFAAPFLAAHLLLPRLRNRFARRSLLVLLALLAAYVGWIVFNHFESVLVLAPAAFWLGTCHAPSFGSPRPFSIRRLLHSGNPLACAFALFAFLLVSKMLLQTTITFYGFVLALPAFCCALLWMFRPPCPAPRAVLAAALLFGYSAAALRLQSSVFRMWDVSCPVHDGAFLAPRAQAHAFNAALDWIRANTPPGSTLAVLPEGAVLNVLSGRPNPTPYVSLPDTDWPRYDEAAVLTAYSNSPPDTLILVRKPQFAEFGTGYAQSLMALLDPLYEPAYAFSLATPTNSRPYLLVATRIPPPPAPFTPEDAPPPPTYPLDTISNSR